MECSGPTGVDEQGTRAKVPQEPGKSRRLLSQGRYCRSKEYEVTQDGRREGRALRSSRRSRGSVQATLWREGSAARWRTPRQFRPTRLHALLGEIPEGQLGGEAEDRQGPFEPCASAHQQVVPTLPTRPNSRAVRDAEEEVERSLRLLRDNGNSIAIGHFRHWVIRLWRKWLDRRSWRSRMNWPKMKCLLKRYPLQQARIRRPMRRLNVANP